MSERESEVVAFMAKARQIGVVSVSVQPVENTPAGSPWVTYEPGDMTIELTDGHSITINQFELEEMRSRGLWPT